MTSFLSTDIEDLRVVNWLAKKDYRWKQFCYAVKDALLCEFGTHDGYDLQQFVRCEWDDEYGHNGEIFSWHDHILERVRIGDVIFHRPTNEFWYRDVRGIMKSSAYYDEYHAKCTGKVDGIKQPPAGFQKADGVKAIRRLTHKFFPLLRSKFPKPERGSFHFFKPRMWMGRYLDGYTVRVPPDIASCSGCGCRLAVRLDTFDLKTDEDTGQLWICRPNFPRWIKLSCDADWNYYGDCPERLKAHIGGPEYPGVPWESEKKIVAEWVRLIAPPFLEWKDQVAGAAKQKEEGLTA